MTALIDLTGWKFTRFTVIRRVERGQRTFWLCRCDCGKKRVVAGGNLRSGNSASCGCLQREVVRDTGKANRTHGLHGTVLYRCWSNMMKRCYNKETPKYRLYGARGIRVCKRWKSLEAFCKDIVREIGERPSDRYSLDRKDNNDNYQPGNVRWATRKQQSYNRRPYKTWAFK